MDADAKTLLERMRDQLVVFPGQVFAPAFNIIQDFISALVSPLGAALPGNKPGDPARLKSGLRLVESLAADAEQFCRFCDRLTIHAMAAHHLIFHLDMIPGIEKFMLSKEFILYGAGGWMEGP